jgi:hypothetical protein
VKILSVAELPYHPGFPAGNDLGFAPGIAFGKKAIHFSTISFPY